MSFSPYLFFGGNCAEAFAFYATVFGTEASIMTHADVPPGSEMPGAQPTDVMHASISLGDSLLMGSDDPGSDGDPVSGMGIAYTAPDPDAAARIFDAIFEGGRIDMPLGETFFSPAFGVGVDRFGVTWMVDTALPEGA